MEEQIVNRVANSSLEVFDLEDYFPKQEIVLFDLKQWLWEELVLKEKDFRSQAEVHSWQQYTNKYIAIDCSSQAIIPLWAYMLIASKLEPFAKKIVKGSIENLLSDIYKEKLSKIDYSYLKNKSVIIKGCTHKPVPDSAYLTVMEYIQPLARSIMYGEACSAVPIFKKK